MHITKFTTYFKESKTTEKKHIYIVALLLCEYSTYSYVMWWCKYCSIHEQSVL